MTNPVAKIVPGRCEAINRSAGNARRVGFDQTALRKIRLEDQGGVKGTNPFRNSIQMHSLTVRVPVLLRVQENLPDQIQVAFHSRMVNPQSAITNLKSEPEDTDRSKYIRNAIREKLSRSGISIKEAA